MGKKAQSVVIIAAQTGASIVVAPICAARDTAVALFFERRRLLAHDDGIVNDDPGHHDEREHRDHVDRLAGQIHHAERRKQRHGDAGRHPERHAGIEEQEQQTQYDGEALNTVLDQDTEALHHELAADVIDLDVERLRQRGPLFLEILGQDIHGPQRIGALRPLHRDLDGRLPAHEPDLTFAIEARIDLGDILEEDFLPAGSRLYLDLANCLRRSPFGARPKLHVLLAFETPGWQVLRVLPHLLGDLLQREPEPAQLRFPHLDPDFFFARAVKRHPVDTGGKKLISDLLRERLQNLFRKRPGERNRSDGIEHRRA